MHARNVLWPIGKRQTAQLPLFRLVQYKNTLMGTVIFVISREQNKLKYKLHTKII